MSGRRLVSVGTAEESGVKYMGTAEVARRLDVKAATVYAYVSRGLLTSVRLPDRRGSWFAESAVEKLAQHGGERSGKKDPLNRVSTAVTLLKDDDLYFRGHRVADLVQRQDLESVAGLLWHGTLDARRTFTASADQLAAVRSVTGALPAGAGPTDCLRAAITALCAADPLRFDLSPVAVTRAGSAMLAAMAVTLGAEDDDVLPLASRLWPALSDRPARPELLDAALVLLADHDLAISTVAARVAASARAHPYAVISAGLGAFDGQYHGAASTLAYRFLAEAVDDPVSAVSERLRHDQTLPGFGHSVYRTADPRAEALFVLLRQSPLAETYLDVVDEIVGALSASDGVFANIDLALAVMMHAFAMRPDAGAAIFAIARTVGWIAHALEEYDQPALRFRPIGIYVGEVPRHGGSQSA